MKHFYFIAVMLVSSVFISCGDTDIIIPQKDVYSNDTIPSFIVDAVNNAKLICDSIGEIKEVNIGKDSFLFKDEKGNTINVDVFGNTEVCSYNNDTIRIDFTVKESTSVSRDTIGSTIWKCCDIYSKYQKNNCVSTSYNDKIALYKLLIDQGIKYEETTYNKERYDTIYERLGSYCFNFGNTMCILNSCDTTKVIEKVFCDNCKKIKVPSQMIETKKYKMFIIDNHDGVLTVSDITPEVELYNDGYGGTKTYYREAIYTIPLDSDGTFSIVEEAGKETIKEKVISTDVHKKHEAYNYRRLQDGRICIYNHDKKYYDDGHLGFKFPYVLNDTTKWLDVKFTKEEDMKH